MNNLGDYLSKRAQELDLGRADELQRIQQLLDTWYPGKARAVSLNNGRLVIQTSSSAVANELRFNTNELNSDTIKKVIIR